MLAMLCEDYRLGGELHYYFGDPAETMRVPEEILKCVVYLYSQDGDSDEERRAIGTAFFVSVRSKTMEGVHPYLVTAKHCVVGPMKRGRLFVRINTVEGSSAYVELKDGWIFPDEPSADVAVLPFALPPEIHERFDFRGIAEARFATPAKHAEHEIGIGDEVIISGLFTRLRSKPINHPIVRFGNIAAMPIEHLVDTKTALDYRAILVEVRSIGGLSGSPVFVYLGPERVPPSKARRPDKRFLMLIGIVRAHWEHEEKGIAFKGSAFSDELDKVNWGIAAITPVSDLMSVLYGDELMARRKEADNEYRMRDGTTDDSISLDKDSTPFTQADFEDALRKTSRKIPKDN
ncbi:MAG: hypothetical protein WA655_09205 [Candidatus Korobacteraceae bacterium]